MAYAYWKTGQHRRPADFELFFCKNPFGGSFTIFAGLNKALNLLASFRFSKDDGPERRPLFAERQRAFDAWVESVGLKVDGQR